MRPLFWLALLALAAPLAAAQTAVAPSLALDPPRIQVPTEGQGTSVVVISNPTDGPIEWALSAEPGAELRASFGRVLVIVPARSHERVELKVAAGPNADNSIQVVRVHATETQASADRHGHAPLAISGQLTVEVGGRAPQPVSPTTVQTVPPDAIAQVPAAFRLVPPRLNVTQGNTTPGAIMFRNTGSEPVVPSFIAVSGPGIVFDFASVASVAPGSEVEIPFGVSARENVPTGARSIEIQAQGTSAPSQFLRLNVLAPVVPPPEPQSPSDEIDPRTLTIAAVAVGAAGTWSALWLSRRHWWPLLASLFAPLYTRLRPSKMLDHPVRARIVEVVKESPGITFGDLARRVDIAAGQLTHHARMLEKAGIVFSSPDGQTRRFFHVAEGRLAPVAPLAERLLRLVQQQPRRSAELARDLGVSRQALHYHVKQLVAQGRVRVAPDGMLHPSSREPPDRDVKTGPTYA